MYVDDSGSVGIGTTTPTSDTSLELAGSTIANTTLMEFGTTNDDANEAKLRIGYGVGAGYFRYKDITMNYNMNKSAKDYTGLSALKLGIGVGGNSTFGGGGFNFQYMPEGTSSWATAMFIDHRYGYVGIGTASPLVSLHVEDGAVLFNGTIGSTPISGEGTRMMWIPAKAAFRAGGIDGYGDSNEWNDAYIGAYSFAAGRDPKASGSDSIAMGWQASALGADAVAIGRNSNASGSQSIAVGGCAAVSGWCFGGGGSARGGGTSLGGGDAFAGGSFAIGTNPTVAGTLAGAGQNSYAIGRYMATGANGAFAIGTQSNFFNNTVANSFMVSFDSGTTPDLFVKSGQVAVNTASPSAWAEFQVSGDAYITGATHVGWENVSAGPTGSITTKTVSCTFGKLVLGGGCDTDGTLRSSYPSSDWQWTCETTAASTITAWAICARLGDQ
jgi:hypothetical protein